MTLASSSSQRNRLRVLGLCLLALLLLPPVRQAAESSMKAHMLLQYPALMLAGVLLAGPATQRWQSGVQRFNQLGIAGLLGAALVMALLMVPRVLDLALVDARIESIKLIALVGSGAALALSWQRAGTVIQAFFLGNVLPMLIVVGTLYQDSPIRLCNAYRLDDQQNLGTALVAVSVAVAALWLLQLVLRLKARPWLPTGINWPARPRRDERAAALVPARPAP